MPAADDGGCDGCCQRACTFSVSVSGSRTGLSLAAQARTAGAVQQFQFQRLLRDGTLMEEVKYCCDPADVHVYPGVTDAVRKLKAAGFAAIVITNQAGIGRGYFTEAQYLAVQEEFLRQVGEGLIDATYYCADLPDVPSSCRKPEPGMLLEAAADHSLDLAGSFFIGDKSLDIECGRRVGTRTIQVLTGYGAEQPCQADFVAPDVVEAVRLVLETVDG